jgi:hypothetical protein
MQSLIYKQQLFQLNDVFEWVTFLLSISEDPGSNLVLEISYPEIYRVFPQYLQANGDRFLQNPFQLTIQL